MALIVEDGSGIAGADSYLSLDDGRDLADKYGIVLPIDDAEAAVKMRLGYLGLNIIEPQLQGSRTHDTQTGCYPREDVKENCTDVDPDAIPTAVQLAQLYYAEAYASGLTTNAVDNNQKLSGFTVVGVYSETYQDGTKATTNSTIQGVYNAMYPLSILGYRNSPCGRGSGFGNGLGREEFRSVGI